MSGKLELNKFSRNKFYPAKTSGAKEGLEQKMAYWKDKDYNYEYGVSVGAAVGLAVQTGAKPQDANFPDKVFDIFQASLLVKCDPRFIETFDDYFSKKHKSPHPIKETIIDNITGEKVDIVQLG